MVDGGPAAAGPRRCLAGAVGGPGAHKGTSLLSNKPPRNTGATQAPRGLSCEPSCWTELPQGAPPPTWRAGAAGRGRTAMHADELRCGPVMCATAAGGIQWSANTPPSKHTHPGTASHLVLATIALVPTNVDLRSTRGARRTAGWLSSNCVTGAGQHMNRQQHKAALVHSNSGMGTSAKTVPSSAQLRLGSEHASRD